MDRPKRAATKVTNFRTFHLSGDLDDQVKGLVDTRIEQFNMSSSKELKQQLELEKESNRKLEEEAEYTCIQHEIEVEKMKGEQWKVAMEKLKDVKILAQQEHSRCMAQMEQVACTPAEEIENSVVTWLKDQMTRLHNPSQEAPDITE